MKILNFKNNIIKNIISIIMIIGILLISMFTSYARNHKVVVLDAGHDAHDSGCCINNVKESIINAELTDKVAHILKKKGIKVYYTHPIQSYYNKAKNDIPSILPENNNQKYDILPNDSGISLCDAINKIKPDAAISIHHNFSFDKNASGLEVYWRSKGSNKKISKRSEKLANIVFNKCKDSYGSDVRTPNPKNNKPYMVLFTKYPTILFETDFLSNKKQLPKIRSAKYQHKMANNISEAICEFLK